MQKIFITGISTEVGKTIASAIFTEALQADYWKPVQAGDLDNTDMDKVKRLISNNKSKFHPCSYELKSAMSPHAAAEIDGIRIDRFHINEPETENHLIIEGSGGILVPLNDEDTMFDIIMPDYKVVVVSRNYLGSINHSLLTIKWLLHKGYDVSVIFSGEANPHTENIILHKTGVSLIGRIDEEKEFTKEVIKKYADRFEGILKSL
ncbi:dethiobiotin synthase [Maribacter stanieri]|jgi:dethiobiotin synthetase|uniref:ATP-dependent dethiobiotin synthetase BioD n=1 Tax=Maribacter stanieri TaxID=440514 RepID=A0A1I6HIY3_9FLAO|nr:dethiobiotin synthase [Maribacter stanieri]SFR54429.1 dethiobiotin synthetase [Maribacter stanieri]|tara:strand:- start:1972 stop:2589 length:618 start_codon:yes stop_codon:yes gene_type:complete